MVRCYNSNGR